MAPSKPWLSSHTPTLLRLAPVCSGSTARHLRRRSCVPCADSSGLSSGASPLAYVDSGPGFLLEDANSSFFIHIPCE